MTVKDKNVILTQQDLTEARIGHCGLSALKSNLKLYGYEIVVLKSH